LDLSLKDIGVEMKGLTAAYDLKRPKLTGIDRDAAKTKKKADTSGN
jgi:hypothetical protein